jgi:hypothetical protein
MGIGSQQLRLDVGRAVALAEEAPPSVARLRLVEQQVDESVLPAQLREWLGALPRRTHEGLDLVGELIKKICRFLTLIRRERGF